LGASSKPHAFEEIRSNLYYPDVQKRTTNLRVHDRVKNALTIYDFESFLKKKTRTKEQQKGSKTIDH
jgi:hypothetical protein